jgi:hypothetical protein
MCLMVLATNNPHIPNQTNPQEPRSIRTTSWYMLALIKHQFHALTCRVNVWNDHVFTIPTNLVPRFWCLFDFRDIGAKLEHFKKLHENVQFYQNKCHAGNAPNTGRPCAKATDVWAQWVAGRPNSLADQPHFVGSREFPWRWRFPRGSEMEPEA